MSISRRSAIAVRTLGVASAAAALALGAAGSAFACKISDFTGSAACNTKDGTATITVLDIDSTARLATLQLFDGNTQIGSDKTVVGGLLGNPGTATFTGVPWKVSGSWTLRVTVVDIIDGQSRKIDSPGGVCSVPPIPSPSKPAPSPTKPTTPPTKPSTSPSPSTPVKATASPSPSGPSLAETGGGSDSGLIAGVAGALVVAGGGAMFALRRRNAAGRH